MEGVRKQAGSVPDEPRKGKQNDHALWAQVGMLQLDSLKLLWKEYVNKLALCLMDLEGAAGGLAQDRLTQLSLEACTLLLRFAVANPTGFRTVASTHLEDSRCAKPCFKTTTASPASCKIH